MKTRKMNRRQAWRYVGTKLLRQRRIADGLCVELDDLLARNLIGDATYDAMEAQLQSHVNDMRDQGMAVGGYLYTESGAFVVETGVYRPTVFGRANFHAERAMGCFWLAMEAA
jgi:hypothetical protein